MESALKTYNVPNVFHMFLFDIDLLLRVSLSSQQTMQNLINTNKIFFGFGDCGFGGGYLLGGVPP